MRIIPKTSFKGLTKSKRWNKLGRLIFGYNHLRKLRIKQRQELKLFYALKTFVQTHSNVEIYTVEKGKI